MCLIYFIRMEYDCKEFPIFNYTLLESSNIMLSLPSSVADFYTYEKKYAKFHWSGICLFVCLILAFIKFKCK